MKEMLENIITKCVEYGIPVATDSKDGLLAYRVSGFSKSGEAFLYATEDAVVCETRYNRVDHVLTFKDLAYIAYEWFENYKDREPFDKEDPKWAVVFSDLRIGAKNSCYDDKDLPF
jgi:hypothetical protein